MGVSDSVVIFVILLLSRIAINRSYIFNELIDEKDVRQMKAKYHIWILSTIFRILVYALRMFSAEFIQFQIKNCNCST